MNMEHRKILGNSEITILLKVWRTFLNQLRGVHRNSHVYQKMSEQLESQYNIQLKPNEIRTRINNLTKKYRAERKKQGKSRGSPSEWIHYSELHRLLGGLKSINDTENMDDNSEHCSNDYLDKSLIDGDESHASSPTAPSPLPAASPSKKRKRNEYSELNKILKQDQDIMQAFLTQSLNNDKQTFELMKESNKLLSEILKK